MSSTLEPTPRPNLHGSNLVQRRLGRPGTRLRSFCVHLSHSWKLRARLERWGSTAEEPGKNDESMPVTPEWQEWSLTRIRFSLAGCVRRKSPPPKLKSPPPPSFFSTSDIRSHILHSMLVSELKGFTWSENLWRWELRQMDKQRTGPILEDRSTLGP